MLCPVSYNKGNKVTINSLKIITQPFLHQPNQLYNHFAETFPSKASKKARLTKNSSEMLHHEK